jgi:hypothetical protein
MKFMTPTEAFIFHLREEILLKVWWPEEKEKSRKIYLENEGSRYLQSFVDEGERMSTRLRVEVMHPSYRQELEHRLLFLSWDIEYVSTF